MPRWLLMTGMPIRTGALKAVYENNTVEKMYVMNSSFHWMMKVFTIFGRIWSQIIEWSNGPTIKRVNRASGSRDVVQGQIFMEGGQCDAFLPGDTLITNP
jgi:hypothetical protein